ncbi:MAG: type II toxin-antitoxin system YafQ family toxin [Desulfobacterales bacterium]|nr:type II toxin-antitoxin system YafQ family toxin [Desulfobacterales bacterium]
MLPIRPTTQFKKDFKKAAKQGRNLDNIRWTLEKLATPEPLPQPFKDHKLKGVWRDFRECHIEPDLLLIYTITDFELRPTRLGTHSQLFG